MKKKRFYLSLVGSLSSIHERLSFCDSASITVVGDVKIKEPLPHTALQFSDGDCSVRLTEVFAGEIRKDKTFSRL